MSHLLESLNLPRHTLDYILSINERPGMNDVTPSPSSAVQEPGYEEYRTRVIGTTIDDRTLLSTDYFNSFNEVVMLLGMLGDMPEVLDDIRAWTFRTYEEHFRESQLSFGPLAIEAYAKSPADVRKRFEALIVELRQTIDEACKILKPATTEDELCRLKLIATDYSNRLQNLIEMGSGIVHGAGIEIDQSAIDKIF
jgi:hypothetical protein